MSHARNLGHEQARRAWNWVSKAKELGKDSDRYGTLARKLPSYLQVSGLGQTLAFLHSNPKKEADKLLLRQLGDHLAEHLGQSRRGAMELILVLEPDQYRAATREAMAMADWLKRFAQGELGEEQG